jgi:flagellin
MASIRTNLQAGLISRQLSNINRRFTTNLERLSTGLRLNRPDDSPGQYGVVINQNLQIQSLNQGVLNAQNAAGMLQTAEEGINTLIDVLNRAHDLAVTAADATLTQAQRQQAQDEVERLLTASDGSAEIQQLLDNVNYNGVKLLADSEKSAAIQGSSVGAVGGKREGTLMGGDKVDLLTVNGNTTTASTMFADVATGVLGSTAAYFDQVSASDLTSVGLNTSKAGMVINMSDVGDTVNKGDILELSITNSSGTTSDQVIVASVNQDLGGVHGADDVTVVNADGHTVALKLHDLLTTGDRITASTDTFSIKRIPQTLILDSTGATATSANFRNFDPGTIGTTNNTDSEFREVMHLGVALKATGDTGAAALSRVSVSFADTDPLAAASKIQTAIEEQLGGEYRKGGSLHIDVTAVADVYMIQNAAISAGGDSNSLLVGSKAEITQDLWTSTKNTIGNGAYTSFAGTTYMDQVGREYVDTSKVYFKFSTTTTAGVNLTPELRVMSDELAGYTNSTYPDRLFGNSLSISTGEHGNDKFMLTIDGEEVEVDLDGDFASSTNSRIAALVDSAEAYTIDQANTTSALTQTVYKIGVSDANTTAGAVDSGTNFQVGTSGTQADDVASGLDYAIGNATSRDYTGGYYSQDNLRTMLTDAINKATTSAKDASVSYDHSTRTFTLTTGSRSNLSSLTIGKSIASNITLGDGTTKATSIVDSTPGTSGFVGALGLSEKAASTGSGSFFEFRLGGDGDTYAINFGTFGVTNMGADQVDISNITLSTQSGAASAISVIEQALDSISTTQTRIGAGINHMQRRVNVMESHREALRGAKARIEEIDFTVETRNLASLQILLQSSTAALAQANIIPQTLLQLLA